MADKGIEIVYKVIFEALEKNNRAERMVQELTEKLGVSICLMDSYGRILVKESAADHKGKNLEICSDEKKWIELMEKYYEAENSQEHLLEQMESGCQIMHPIKVKDNIEGFCITYQEDVADVKRAIEINSLIARMVAVRFKLSEKIDYLDESAAKQIISRLLLGTLEDEENLPKISQKMYDLYVVAPFVLAVIALESEQVTLEQKIRKKINDNFESSLTYKENNKVFALFMDVNTPDKQQEVCQCIQQIAECVDVTAVISDRFDNIEEIVAKKKVLGRVIKIGARLNGEERVFKEYDYYLELICSYAYEEIGYQGYCNKELELLEKEDKEKGTEFCKSLREYLACGNNVNLAAKKIFIHRNTMVYRLGKIHEIMGVDINEPEVAKKLLISMTLRTLHTGK